MTPDLHKRIEEAAKKYEPDAFDADYILPAREGFIVSGKRAAFRAGAELGYKEAITLAKEWLEDNARYYSNTVTGRKAMVYDFEADMSKLLEE